MPIPKNVIVNADDLGLSSSINAAILMCYNKGYINSASLLTNMAGFDDAVQLIHHNQNMDNIGVHVNLAEGRPIIFNNKRYQDTNGNWDISKTNKKTMILNAADKQAFLAEIYAQVDKALAANIRLTHLDSHFHIHTLPCFYKLFLQAARLYNLKIRLAQTYREGNYLKYWVRRFINAAFIKGQHNYTTYFETVEVFLKRDQSNMHPSVEVMLHPDLDTGGHLTDHVDAPTMVNWLAYLNQ